MKKLFFIFAIVAFTNIAFTQVNFGIKAGLNTINVNDEIINLNVNDFSFAVDEAQYGFHAGIFLRAKLGPILLQPELVFNSDNVDYTFDQGALGQSIVNQKYRSVDLPVLVGIKLGPIRLLGGPVAHYQFESIVDIREDIISEDIGSNVALGLQVGGGFDIKKLTFDIRYEVNGNKIGDSLSVLGEGINFSQNRNRIVASVGYKF